MILGYLMGFLSIHRLSVFFAVLVITGTGCGKMTNNGYGDVEGALVSASGSSSTGSASFGAGSTANPAGCTILLGDNTFSFSPLVPVNEALGYLVLLTCPSDVNISITNVPATNSSLNSNLVVVNNNGVKEVRLKNYFYEQNQTLNTVITMNSPSNVIATKGYTFVLGARVVSNSSALFRHQGSWTQLQGNCTHSGDWRYECPRGAQGWPIGNTFVCILYSKPSGWVFNSKTQTNSTNKCVSNFFYDANTYRLYMSKSNTMSCPVGTSPVTIPGPNLPGCNQPMTHCLVATINNNTWPVADSTSDANGFPILAKNIAHDLPVNSSCTNLTY